MATKNRLTASLRGDDAEKIGQVEEDLDMERPDAERRLVREGLTRLGYKDDDENPEDVLAEYARKIGSVLGLVGIVMLGYGVFGLPEFRYIGYGLVLSGFGLIAGSEFGPALRDRLGSGAEAEEVAG